MPAGSLTHTGAMLRHSLRLDRLWLPVWILACVTFAVCFVPMLPILVDNEQMLEVLKMSMESPAVIAMCGMIYGEEYTFGIMYTQMMLVWSAVVVCVMNIMLVNRHTRKDEEEGRLELISSLPIGKASPLASLAIIVVGTNVLVALLTAVSLAAFGLESIDLAGSLVYGASVGGIGLIFAALTMLFAQLASTSKGTLGLSMAALVFMYLLRAPADMAKDAATNPLGFISPFGLGERTYPYYENLWWPIVLMVFIAAVLMLVAFLLNVRRNLGVGLLPAGRGKAHGGRLLIGHISLSIRLVRGTIIIWALVFLAFGLSYGVVFNDLQGFYEESQFVASFLGVDDLTQEIFSATINSLTALMTIAAVVPVVMIINHLYGEERKGRLELVFSTATSKVTTLLGYTIIVAVAALIFQLLTALGMWMGSYYVMEEPIALEVFVKTAINYLPAVLAFAGVAVLLIGLAPKAIHAIWFYLAYVFYVVYVGGMLNIAKIFVKLTPLGLLAKYPTDAFDPLPFVLLLLVFAALSAGGIIAYRARDIK